VGLDPSAHTPKPLTDSGGVRSNANPAAGDRGVRQKVLRSGQNEIAGGHSRSNHIAQEMRRAARVRAFIARRRNVPHVSVLPPSYGGAR
jgi:hypothetical protein